MINQALTIGRLAKFAGVNVETIRYYQRRGLLLEPKKPLGGVRHYSDSDVSRIHFIKSAQRLGFTLDEITVLLKLEDGTHCVEAREIAVQKLAMVRGKIAGLKNIESSLVDLVRQCDTSQGSVCCPLINSLQHHV
jgi:MerR family mercuric resistance operon transcriptional regulator